jgi:hypothetical protein
MTATAKPKSTTSAWMTYWLWVWLGAPALIVAFGIFALMVGLDVGGDAGTWVLAGAAVLALAAEAAWLRTLACLRPLSAVARWVWIGVGLLMTAAVTAGGLFGTVFALLAVTCHAECFS